MGMPNHNIEDTMGRACRAITDIGGPLSHGSIVAREYGIPAVMGTGVATRRIHTGEVIMVDGSPGLMVLSHNGLGVARESEGGRR
jgi:phosphoenolpyruvate-protein kinase (PTS system EI component)